MPEQPTPFSLDPDEDEGDDKPEAGAETSTIKEIRDAAKRAEKRAEAAERKAEEYATQLQGYVAKEQDAVITSVFKEVGLNEAHGQLFKDLNKDLAVSDITADKVKEFASTYQLPVQETGEVPEAPAPKSSGFTPPPVTGVPTPAEKLTLGDIDKMLRSGDQEAVDAAFKAGRVETVEAPWPMDPNRRRV